jgi:hypothetical protein
LILDIFAFHAVQHEVIDDVHEPPLITSTSTIPSILDILIT